MCRLLVNIRGCNGSGKTTIPASMMNDPKVYTVSKPYKGKDYVIITVFPSYKWVALGNYYKKTGGLDQFSDNTLTEKVIRYAVQKFPDYNIMMEGVIASTIFSTYAVLFKALEIEYDIKPIIISLLPPVEVCLKRVYERNGGKPIKEEAVIAKWRMVERGHEKFKKEGFIALRLDNSHIPKEKMLKAIMKKLDKIQEILEGDWI